MKLRVIPNLRPQLTRAVEPTTKRFLFFRKTEDSEIGPKRRSGAARHARRTNKNGTPRGVPSIDQPTFFKVIQLGRFSTE